MSKFFLSQAIISFIAIISCSLSASCSSINKLLEKGGTEALPIVGEMEMQEVEKEVEKELPRKRKNVKKMPQYKLPEHISI